ncbi:MAG TPA: hypothetical protein VHX39_17220 [Acetobacteraceae bacterium]|jgi:hypothetical protein|nr:hypothetical protein [Acetobacteraceae bacterium]
MREKLIRAAAGQRGFVVAPGSCDEMMSCLQRLVAALPVDARQFSVSGDTDCVLGQSDGDAPSAVARDNASAATPT